MSKLIDFHTNCTCGRDIHTEVSTIGITLHDGTTADVISCRSTVDGRPTGVTSEPLDPVTTPNLTPDDHLDALIASIQAGHTALDDVRTRLGLHPPDGHDTATTEHHPPHAANDTTAPSTQPPARQEPPSRPRRGGGAS